MFSENDVKWHARFLVHHAIPLSSSCAYKAIRGNRYLEAVMKGAYNRATAAGEWGVTERRE